MAIPPGRMRVLILAEACGGVARHVADLCAGLQEQGVEVHLIYSPLRGDAILAAGLERLATLGVPASAIPMRPEPGLADLRSLLRIRRYLLDHGPFDVIHGHSSKGGALARLVPAPGRPVRIYTPHAFVTMSPAMGLARRMFYGWVEHLLAAIGDAVIATSPLEYEHARTHLHLSGRRLFLVPNGIGLSSGGGRSPREELRRGWGVGPDEVVIGSLARFVPQKNPELLVGAFAEALRSGPAARLVMVGDGPLRERLEADVSRLGLSGAVVFPGYLQEPRVMEAFDLFALASRYEGFPYVLLDALAAGLPVVTTAVGGADMVVTQGGNGFVVPVGDERGLAEALASLIADPLRRQRMGAASLVRARDFDVAAMIRDTVAIYRGEAQSSPRPSPPS